MGFKGRRSRSNSSRLRVEGAITRAPLFGYRPKRNLRIKRVPFLGKKGLYKATGTLKMGIRAYSGS